MIEVSFDGAASSNPGLAGGGIYIKDGKGHEMRHALPFGILSSNHEAEFAACVAALRIALENNYRTVSFRTDSQLVNQALEKRYVKNSLYAAYLKDALHYIDQFDLFFCKWIPDKQNKNADALARLAIKQQSEK
ncbi:reverse transcriptase-like protein [Sporolactobacillus terrae]|uniref:Ribonuclease H n=1 Tax=Sporolactobacillus terrae TaxID=269673 RepID=A0A410D8Q3_9BACL|nr:reverse transcriptase-like protein [Sporolactobacillus terrae]QAA22482.1 ribonuclease HI [Sporolactobacillus terrae]QAA25456.1 ribonuclease HI [Sporolactobacillus terrae]UAK17266.1 reverse transcriptase-like protein [Sporolactobacillus terrae]BBN98792.1 ribonuclease H [Sporolactobacillus terrae]